MNYNLLIGKTAIPRFNSNKHSYEIGKPYKINTYVGSSSFILQDEKGYIGNHILLSDLNIVDEDIVEKGFKKNNIKPIEKDQYEISPVLAISENNEDIYISTSARNLLELEENSSVGFATDFETEKMYIFKEKEENSGLKVDGNGIIKSIGICRDLMNYVGSKEILINFKRIKNPDYADDTFFNLMQYVNPSKLATEIKTVSKKKKSIDELIGLSFSNYGELKQEYKIK